MSADCGKLENSNCFRHAHKGDFPKFSHKISKERVLSINIAVVTICSLHVKYFERSVIFLLLSQ